MAEASKRAAPTAEPSGPIIKLGNMLPTPLKLRLKRKEASSYRTQAFSVPAVPVHAVPVHAVPIHAVSVHTVPISASYSCSCSCSSYNALNDTW